MIKAFECVRQGCLQVQSEASLTQEKLPLLEGDCGSSAFFWKEKSADKGYPPPPSPRDLLFKTWPPLPPSPLLFSCADHNEWKSAAPSFWSPFLAHFEALKCWSWWTEWILTSCVANVFWASLYDIVPPGLVRDWCNYSSKKIMLFKGK